MAGTRARRDGGGGARSGGYLLRSLPWPARSRCLPARRRRHATVLPTGFKRGRGLQRPRARRRRCRFAPDGRVFVAEKRGVIKVFDGLADPTPARRTPTCGARCMDLVRPRAARAGDGAGLPCRPRSIYVAVRARRAARRDRRRSTTTRCPQRRHDGAAWHRRSRVSRISVAHGRRDRCCSKTGACSTPSHTIGAARLRARRRALRLRRRRRELQLRPTGARTVMPPNPCGDPPGSVGTALTPPTAEGGALRSQDVRTTV